MAHPTVTVPNFQSHGGAVISNRWLADALVVRPLVSKQTGRSGSTELTAREVQILSLIAEGKSDWEIGKILDFSNQLASTTLEHILSDPVPLMGKAWVAKNADLVASMPPNTVIAINVSTGEHVTSTDGLTVMDLFEDRFPDGYAWVHDVDGPITVGGGLWALSSEA